MPKYPFLFLLLLLHQYSFSQTTDILQLKQLNQDWIHAYVTKDSARLNEIFADDFELISPRGDKWTKWDVIRNLDKQNIVSTNVDSVAIKLLSKEVGLITAYTSFELKVDDKSMSGKNCYQDVYVKRKNRWYAVAAHVTLLQIK